MSHFDLSSKNKQIEDYDKQTLEPDFWQDQKKAQQVIRAKNALKDIVDRYEELDLQLFKEAFKTIAAEMYDVMEFEKGQKFDDWITNTYKCLPKK